MRSHAIRSHLTCVSNNLGWIKDVAQFNALAADHCPGRHSILKNCGHDAEIESILCDCERACVEMRDAYNRRELGVLVRAANARSVCLEKLGAALKKYQRPDAWAA